MQLLDNPKTENQAQSKLQEIDGVTYSVKIHKRQNFQKTATQILIPTFITSEQGVLMVRLCLESIQKRTHEPYEIWVVDNTSPKHFNSWLLAFPEINIVFNETEPKNPFWGNKSDGSYANAIALELVLDYLPKNAPTLFTMHSDVFVTSEKWLSCFQGKLQKSVGAVGFRRDEHRVQAIHVAGMLVDYKLFQKLNMSFLPNMRQERFSNFKEYDVGDQVTLALEKNNYKTAHFENSFNNPQVIKKINKKDALRNFDVDRVFSDDGEVLYLHLGRGTVKASNQYQDKKKVAAEDWITLCENHLQKSVKADFLESAEKNLWHSVRRSFVDTFFEKYIGFLAKEAKVLDMGGKKENKRGKFDIEKLKLEVQYANLSSETNPDYLCDIAKVPVSDNVFDGVILAEVLEHVEDPLKVLEEAFRVLKAGGRLFVTTPFQYPIHPDPKDYNRFTDTYFKEKLSEVGFKVDTIEKQGLFFSVLANMFKQFGLEMMKKDKLKNKFFRKIVYMFVFWFEKKSIIWDQTTFCQTSRVLSGTTTGFGIVCKKPGHSV